MELRHIRYFLAIADEGNFTRAAERLGIGQPPLSQQIKALEDEIGVRLFRRVPHGAELTEAGRAFLRKVAPIPGEVSEGVRMAKRAAEGQTGLLRLGFTGSAALNPIVPACIRDFRRRYPEVELAIEEDNSVALSAAILGDRIDVAILRPAANDPAELSVELLHEEPLAAALPQNHPLAQSNADFDLGELKNDALILSPREVGISLHDAALEACRQAGFEPERRVRAPQIASILSLVAAEMGVALIPASLSNIHPNGVVLRRLGPDYPTVSLAVACRRGTTSVLVRNFIRCARERAGL
jgi:DNA-binding transcriptional LysR family regulator